MLKRLILFLVRKKLGVKKFEAFRFTNQKSTHDWYYFGNYSLVKCEYNNDLNGDFKPAGVSLNWLLDDNCKIRKLL